MRGTEVLLNSWLALLATAVTSPFIAKPRTSQSALMDSGRQERGQGSGVSRSAGYIIRPNSP